MGCLKLTYRNETSPLRVSRELENDVVNWQVWMSKNTFKQHKGVIVAQNGGNDGNLLGDASTYLGVASSALLLSDEFRATSTGKYVHVNGATYKIGFRGNQHLSKYTVQASKINTASTARFVGKISNALVLVGAGVTVYDGISNGWENHHTADLLVTGGFYALAVSIPVAGWIAGGVYLAADLTTQYYTGKSITENIFD